LHSERAPGARTNYLFEGPESSVKLRASFLVGLIAVCASARYLASQAKSKPMSTDERLLTRGWWPTKGSEPRDRYVGTAACASCHAHIVETQKTTPMAHASMTANSEMFAKSDVRSPLTFRAGAYSYKISQTTPRSVYSASDGTQSVATPLDWAFGSGHFGQTYVYQQNGIFYESNLSYYPAIQALDFTTGHSRSAAPSLSF